MCLVRRFAFPLAIFIVVMTLSPDIALGQCNGDDSKFRDRITAPGMRGALNLQLPRPHQVHAVPMCPHQILLAWFKNPNDDRRGWVDSHDYRYRARGAAWSGWKNRAPDPLPAGYPSDETSVYNPVFLKDLEAGTVYEFEVRSVDEHGGISAAVLTSATAVGRRTISITPLSGSVMAGDPLRFEVSREQPHGRLNVMVRVTETGNLLRLDPASPNWFARTVSFRDGQTMARLEVYTDVAGNASFWLM